MTTDAAIEPLAEDALLLRFGDGIDIDTNARVHAAARALRAAGLSGIIDIAPAYATLLVRFDCAEWSDCDAAQPSARFADVILAAIGDSTPYARTQRPPHPALSPEQKAVRGRGFNPGAWPHGGFNPDASPHEAPPQLSDATSPFGSEHSSTSKLPLAHASPPRAGAVDATRDQLPLAQASPPRAGAVDAARGQLPLAHASPPHAGAVDAAHGQLPLPQASPPRAGAVDAARGQLPLPQAVSPLGGEGRGEGGGAPPALRTGPSQRLWKVRGNTAVVAHAPDGSLEIPVCYGDEYGPDLDAVAAHARLARAEVIARHAAGDYVVAMLGFAPGFPYLLGLDPALHTPRRANPRTRVPAGSVAIGGAQTGIYPRALPGGWQLIGRTPLALFDPQRDPCCVLAPGDHVRFRAIDARAFRQLAARDG